MFSLKNNRIRNRVSLKLCKIHNDKKETKAIAKMFTRKSSGCIKVFNFLKNKKPRKQISVKSVKHSKLNLDNRILSKRYQSTLSNKLEQEWVYKNDVINWLKQTGIEVKISHSGRYLVEGKDCSLIQLVIFANKKRLAMGLSLFCIHGLTEN